MTGLTRKAHSFVKIFIKMLIYSLVNSAFSKNFSLLCIFSRKPSMINRSRKTLTKSIKVFAQSAKLVSIKIAAVIFIFFLVCSQTALADNSILSGIKNWASGDKSSSNEEAQSTQSLQLTAIQPQKDLTSESSFDPESLFPQPSGFDKQAFQSVTKQSMPMTPSQIIKLKKMLDVTQRAAAVFPGAPPKPVLSTQAVNLSPGVLPPVIRLQQGFVTSVVFVDSTGADWPIEGYDLGNTRAFNIQWQHDSNTMMIQAISRYTVGNLAVKLKSLSTPVMLTLIPGQEVVDYRMDLHIQQKGPNAKEGEKMPAAANDLLMGVLDGLPPKGAVSLSVSGGGCSAWSLGDKMFLRTRFSVLSPAWSAMMSSPDGTKAYEMEKSSMVLVSKYGRPTELKLEG